MAAYSAIASFRQTLKQLLDSDEVALDFPKPQIESIHQNVCSLQTSLDQIPFVPRRLREKMKELQTDIREEIYIAQDKVEYSIKGSSPERSEETPIKKIADGIATVEKEAKAMAEEIKKDPDAQDLFSEDSQPAKINYSGKERIVGQEEDFKQINDWLELDDKQLLLIPITGLPGIGKTTLARSIYDDQQSKNQFNIRAWVTVSQEYHYQEIFSKLLSSMESKNYQAGHYTTQGDEQTLRSRLHQELYNQRYLIVIDDIWESHVWDRIKLALPDKENGSRILFTTRNQNVAEKIKETSGIFLKMKPLSLDDSWKLLCYKTFTYEACEPFLNDIDRVCLPLLKDTGRSIAKNCAGLPLSIVVVGGLLSQSKDKLEYWKRVNEDTAEAATNGEESYMEILSLSYNYLPGKLKGCFLYMGAFPEDSEIRVTKLIKLWVAEGFLTLSKQLTIWEQVAEDSMEQLIGRNLVSIRRPSSNSGMKICGMHDSLRELAEKESKIEKFFHSRKKYDQDVDAVVESQRRVSIHRNILMCLEDVYNSTQRVKRARSLLYVGSHHHHPMPFVLTFDLLRVLDAFTAYFIQFPEEFLQLVHLTYLSFTYNGKINAKIAELKKLQVLMVRREPKIIFVGASFLPDEIWKMPELRHIWLTETDLPPLPKEIDQNRALLANLQTLANVDAAYFTDEVLDNMPNVKKLSMWIEGPEEIKFNLTKLSKLEFFKFVVLNPIPGKAIGVEAKNFFVKTVRRLHLSGCGLPWEYMKFVAAELKDLEVLKLKEMAFHGKKWSPDYEFKKLKYLLIEYLGFEKWEASNSQFPSLQKLIMRHCYELEKIPEDFQYIGPLELVELVDCSPDVVDSAEDFRNKSENYQVRIFSSWE